MHIFVWAHTSWYLLRLQGEAVYTHALALLMKFLWTPAMIFQIMHICLCVPHYIWSFVCACVFPPPHLCVSAHMGSFMSQQPRRSLKVTNHFLKWGTSSLADKLSALSLQGVCKCTVGDLLVCVEFIFLRSHTYWATTSWKW